MPASGEAEGHPRGLDMTLSLCPWLPVLLLLLTAGSPGRVCGTEQTTQEALLEADAELSGGSGAVPSNNVVVTTWSSVNRNPDDPSLDVIQVRGGIPNIAFTSTETPTESPAEDTGWLVLMVVAPFAFLLLITMVIAGFAIWRRCNNKTSSFHGGKEEDFLAGGDAEKVPMPMFEDDVPSVMELEMEDLEKWMGKDSEGADRDSGKEK